MNKLTENFPLLENGRPAQDPMLPGKALRMIFEDNMGLSLSEVSRKSSIDIASINAIVSGEASIDRPTAEKLKKAFGGVAEALWKMQYVYDYFRAYHERPPQAEIYKIAI